MAKKKIDGKTNAKIAADIALYLGVEKRTAEVYVHRWLETDTVPSQKALIAIHKAGYPIEPFVFGKEKWKRLRRGDI